MDFAARETEMGGARIGRQIDRDIALSERDGQRLRRKKMTAGASGSNQHQGAITTRRHQAGLSAGTNGRPRPRSALGRSLVNASSMPMP
jgi:hypothetical protein